MIKKLNIALVVAVLVLFGLKCLKEFLEAQKAERSRAAMEELAVSDRNAEFTPRLYSSVWHPFVNPNPISRRNGFVADVLKSIFPKLEIEIMKGGITNYIHCLETDPHAIVCNFGDLPEFERFPKAPTRVSWMCYGLFFSRDLKWRYEGPESLDKLRIGCVASHLDSPVIRAFREKWKDTPGKFTLIKGNTFNTAEISGIETGEYDAFVGMLKGTHAEQARSDAHLYMHYSKSEPIDVVDLFVRCSNLDPEYTKAFIEAYEKGIKEIEASGELRRIKEYYHFRDDAKEIKW